MSEQSLFTPYDEALQTKELQILKSVFPYTRGSVKKQLSMIIQLLQMNHAIKAASAESNMLTALDLGDRIGNQTAMLNSVKKYCNEKEIETIDTFINILSLMNQE